MYHWTNSRWNGLQGSSSDRPYAISVTVRTGKKGLRHRGVPFLFSERHVSAKPLPSLVVEDSDGKRHNLITRENYGFLRDSFFRYAYLMEKEAVHTPGRTFGEGIARLHEEMDDLVGEGLNVNIEEQDGRLLFKLWKAHHWGKLTLYYFPMKFVEALGPELRRISITFIHELMKANGIQTVLDEDDTEYVLTWISEEVPEEVPEERKKRLRLLHSYENGRIKRLLQGWNASATTRTCRRHLTGIKPGTTTNDRWFPP